MVYCTRCGTNNSDSSNNCTNCGAPLFGAENKPQVDGENRYSNTGYSYSRRGSGIGLLIAGLFVIIVGLAVFFGIHEFWRYFWPFVLVLIGAWIVLVGLRRNRRYNQSSPS